ncbi:MAG: hypothetical protein JWM73_536 [Solirubrobacterales bacterium]|nr:hypothetical protein [Solirubrobacterales bacterium]
MRPESERTQIAEMVTRGVNDCAISRATGIPRATVRDWRHGRFRTASRSAHGDCLRCGGDAHDYSSLPGSSYAYLLGAYLGDGHLARGARDVYRLRIFLDSRYPQIIYEVGEAMERVMPGKHARRELHKTAAMVHVEMWSKQWPCLFPQHGPGRKHDRSIYLAEWQQRIVDQHHEEFLRGLIHSDGCRHINRVWRNGKAYEYSRYNFSNVSADIRALFCASCDALDIAWRRMNARNISVARRDAVAALDAFVGPKC